MTLIADLSEDDRIALLKAKGKSRISALPNKNILFDLNGQPMSSPGNNLNSSPSKTPKEKKIKTEKPKSEKKVKKIDGGNNQNISNFFKRVVVVPKVVEDVTVNVSVYEMMFKPFIQRANVRMFKSVFKRSVFQFDMELIEEEVTLNDVLKEFKVKKSTYKSTKQFGVKLLQYAENTRPPFYGHSCLILNDCRSLEEDVCSVEWKEDCEES